MPNNPSGANIGFILELENAAVYTVDYNVNGGSGAPAAQSKKHDTNLTLSSTVPTRPGYTFKGWSTTADGEVVYNPGDVYGENNEITLYAVWEENTVYGDVSGDGEVSVSDVIHILQVIAGSGFSDLTETQKTVADIDGDGFISVSDAIRILRHIANPNISLNPNS